MSPRIASLVSATSIIFAGLLVAPALVSAQGDGGDRRRRDGPTPARMLERMEQRLERMKGPLNLSQRQETRIREVLRRGASEAEGVLERRPDRSPERREALRRVRWGVEDRVRAILSCEQREQLRRFRREHRRERRARRRSRPGRRGRRGSAPDGGI